MFIEGEMIILNEKASKGYPNRVGTRGIIVENLHNSPNYSYKVEFDDGEILPVREIELNKPTDKDIEWMSFIFTGNKVINKSSNELVKIVKADYLNKHLEIEFDDNTHIVTYFDKVRVLDYDINSVEESIKEISAHEELLNLFFDHYRNSDDTFTVPKQLLINLLKQIYTEMK